ncbi:AAA family ATPase [Nanoarchaeota archaeon]
MTKLKRLTKNLPLKRKNTAILVSGTPGTGKTTIAKYLTKILNSRLKTSKIKQKQGKIYKYLDVNKLIKNNNLADHYDKQKKSYIVDEKRLTKHLEKLMNSSKNTLIIDSHMSHFLRSTFSSICIITICSNLKTLKHRLERRNYSKDKVRENLDSEIFQTCLNEAKELKHNILVVDTAKPWKTKLKSSIKSL